MRLRPTRQPQASDLAVLWRARSIAKITHRRLALSQPEDLMKVAQATAKTDSELSRFCELRSSMPFSRTFKKCSLRKI